MTIYEKYIKRILQLEKNFQVTTSGRSFLNAPIFTVKPFDTKPRVLITAAIHAREYVTTFMLLDLIERFGNLPIEYVPMANPDGVRLATEGRSFYETYKERLTDAERQVIETSNLLLWKANARCVDLNVNFDAGWGKGEKNATKAGSENYIGDKPFSEFETKVLKRLSLDKKCVICYHSLGEEIYYGYNNEVGKAEAKMLAEKTGYAYKTAKGSHGGHKDWFIKSGLGIGLTVEVGSENMRHPIGIEEAKRLADENEGIKEVLREFKYV